MKWATVIREKANELRRFLTGRTQALSFIEPAPVLERENNHAVREEILTLTQSEARERGIGKSMLHYLRKRARNQQPFRIYSKVRKKMASEPELP